MSTQRSSAEPATEEEEEEIDADDVEGDAARASHTNPDGVPIHEC